MPKRRAGAGLSRISIKRRRIMKQNRLRRYRKFNKRSNKNRTVMVPRGLAAPRRLSATLVYVEDIDMNAAGAQVPAVYTFRANSIFDPNYTGTGHQPRGHDQWNYLYDKYYVYEATLSATFSSHTDAVNEANVVGITCDDTSGYENDAELLRERPGFVYKTLDTSRMTTTLSKTFRPRNVFQGHRNPDDLITEFGSNPNDTAYFHLYTFSPSSIDDPPVVNVQVRITYKVIISDVKLFGSS